jgi:type I restriction enzyme S subunit
MTPVAVGECVKSVKKWNPAKEAVGGTFRYIDIASVSQEEKIIVPNDEISTSEAPGRARQLVACGDVLVSTVRPNLNAVALVPEKLDGATASTGFCVLRPDINRLDSNYLFHWVRTHEFVTDMVKKATGQSYPAISDKIVKDSLIPLPPLEEQKRIAAILDQADGLRRLRQRAIDRLNSLGQAIFYEMFGAANAGMSWPNVAIDEIFEVARGGSPRPIQKFLTDDPNGINWIMISDASLSNKYITKTKQRIIPEGGKKSRDVKPGDFLLTNSMSFGRPYIMRTTGCIHDGWLLLRPRNEKVDQDFFYHLLGSSEVYARLAARAPGSTVKNLNSDIVRETLVPLPPIQAQKQFSRRVEDVEKQRESQIKSLAQVKLLFSSLQHRAFRGEL